MAASMDRTDEALLSAPKADSIAPSGTEATTPSTIFRPLDIWFGALCHGDPFLGISHVLESADCSEG